jgi:ribosomal protein L37AE/L43A
MANIINQDHDFLN